MKSGFQGFPSASGRRPAPRTALAAGRWPRPPDPNRHTSAVGRVPSAPPRRPGDSRGSKRGPLLSPALPRTQLLEKLWSPPERFLLGWRISPRALLLLLHPHQEVHPLLLLPPDSSCSSWHATGLFPLVNPFLGTTVRPIFPSKEPQRLCSHRCCPLFGCRRQWAHPPRLHLTPAASAFSARQFCFKSTPYKL